MIQRVPDLAALAIRRARDMAKKKGYVEEGEINYRMAMAHWRELGFERNIFPSAFWHRRDAGSYFTNCIEQYYGVGEHHRAALMGKGYDSDEADRAGEGEIG